VINPHVEPVAFAHGPEGEVVVEVHQVVGHVFRIENCLIKRFDIRGA
jgi:hypothetical protein